MNNAQQNRDQGGLEEKDLWAKIKATGLNRLKKLRQIHCGRSKEVGSAI